MDWVLTVSKFAFSTSAPSKFYLVPLDVLSTSAFVPFQRLPNPSRLRRIPAFQQRFLSSLLLLPPRRATNNDPSAHSTIHPLSTTHERSTRTERHVRFARHPTFATDDQFKFTACPTSDPPVLASSKRNNNSGALPLLLPQVSSLSAFF
ncbi:hypothetical protein BT69DRAFT_566723 [Atractiella rhizophila]|nr:hypothetical protein BT69DRAFT_566723 [Atractiella rhizophila]